MPESTWWAATDPAELCQGDVFPDLPFGFSTSPLTHVRSRTLKGGLEGWENVEEPTRNKKDNKYYLVAEARVSLGMIISHGCEIDKPFTDRLLAVPVNAMNTLEERLQTIVLEQKSPALLPLPEIPGYGDYYADLRLISALPKVVFDLEDRVCVMSTSAVERLHAQIVAFFLRRHLPSL